MLGSTSPAVSPDDPYEQLIAQIIRIERQPQFRLKAEREEQKRLKGVLGDFDSKLSALRTQLKSITDVVASPFTARASTTESSAFSITASDGAPVGAREIQVERLAKADTRVSRQLASGGAELRSFFDDGGAQTGTIYVATPTDEDPEARTAITFEVDPEGATNEELMERVASAINTAMADAVSEGTISSTAAASASVVKETSGTVRLSVRSGASGYAGRLGFDDSSGGLLSMLQVNRNALAGSGGSYVSAPATAASVTGEDVGPVAIGLFNRSFDVAIDGVERNVTLATGTYNTAEDLAAALSDALGAGVTVGTDGDALTLTSDDVGSGESIQILGGSARADLGFSVMSEPATGTDEETTAIDPATSGGQITAVGTGETDSELNSKFVVDGLTLYRSSNQVTAALKGLTINLQQTSEAAEAFTVEPDSEGIVENVKAFLDSYNGVIGYVKTKAYVDGDTGERGDFAGDSTITALRFGMRSDVVRAVPGFAEGQPNSLTALGIEIADDGTLTLADEGALLDAVAQDAGAVQRLFSADDGVATRMLDRLDGYLGSGGIIDGREDSIDERTRRLDKRIGVWDERLARREIMLREQYAKLQETIALLQGQQQSLGFFY